MLSGITKGGCLALERQAPGCQVPGEYHLVANMLQALGCPAKGNSIVK